MSNVLTSIGVIHSILAETTAGTRPTTGYVKIPKIYENSELDLDPESIDTDNYDNLRYKTSTFGKIDTSGIQSLTAIATIEEDAETIWDNAVNDYESGKRVWLCIEIPQKADATYIPIVPIRTGAYTTALNDKISIKLKYTIDGDLVFDTKPTAYASAT